MELHDRIGRELTDLEQTVQLASDAWQGVSRLPEEQVHFLNSLALNLHSFYNGVERIFELIARRLDPAFPGDEHWHRTLLEQMGREIEGVRPAVLSKEASESLKDFLAFRHRIRNLYTFHLDAIRLHELLARLPDTWQHVRADIETFQDLLREAASDDT